MEWKRMTKCEDDEAEQRRKAEQAPQSLQHHRLHHNVGALEIPRFRTKSSAGQSLPLRRNTFDFRPACQRQLGHALSQTRGRLADWGVWTEFLLFTLQGYSRSLVSDFPVSAGIDVARTDRPASIAPGLATVTSRITPSPKRFAI
jgi:hypothetical protein